MPYVLQADTAQSTGHGLVHSMVSVSAGHATPPFDGDVTMERVRVWVPLPQVSEHVPNALQADTTQSTGHGELHAWVSVRAGHATPPFDAGVTTERLRV